MNFNSGEYVIRDYSRISKPLNTAGSQDHHKKLTEIVNKMKKDHEEKKYYLEGCQIFKSMEEYNEARERGETW